MKKELSEPNEKGFSHIKKVIISCVAGSALEWYDFAVYAYFAAIIGKLFFPSGDTFQQIIASFGAFASGLIARPVGAVVFGYIGDKFGRKKALVYSIRLMVFSTALMGLLPTYVSAGVWAGALLTLIRITQGLALGGGFTGTIVFLYEHSPEEKRSTYSSWAPFSLVSGFILGALMAGLMDALFDQQQIEAFGWRIPFLISFIGKFIADYVKNKLSDPEEFAKQQDAEKGKKPSESFFSNLCRNHWKGLLLVTMTDALTAAGYFLIAVFFTTYFETILGMHRHDVLLIQSFNMVFLALLILLGGRMADRIGKRKQMLVSSLALAVLAYPLFLLMEERTFAGAFLGELGVIFLFAMYYGPIPAAICSMFPTKVRLAGVSIAHNLAMAAFGAYAPSWATSLVKHCGSVTVPAWLFVGFSLATALALFVWREGKEY
ncbi:MAG: MFS transporter [Holosporaceae bacterium]|jgi:MHS family proline/betaine transporter-like MFS transporter|nr:MFS transporter [Holosporaceae bacterium]